VFPGVDDGSGQRVIACLLVVDCEATRVELGLIVVGLVIGAAVAAKYGDVVQSIFVEKVCVGSQGCENFARALSLDLVPFADVLDQQLLRDLNHRQGSRIVRPFVIREAMHEIFWVLDQAREGNDVLIAVAGWVREPFLRIGQH